MEHKWENSVKSLLFFLITVKKNTQYKLLKGGRACFGLTFAELTVQHEGEGLMPLGFICEVCATGISYILVGPESIDRKWGWALDLKTSPK